MPIKLDCEMFKEAAISLTNSLFFGDNLTLVGLTVLVGMLVDSDIVELSVRLKINV